MATRQLQPSRNVHRLPWHAAGSRRLPAHWLVLALVLSGLSAAGPAARAAEPDAKPSDEPARPFLARHCQGCHAGDKPKGKFRLSSLTADWSDRANRERWLAVSEQVRSGAMPPKGKPRPPAERRHSLDGLDSRPGGGGGKRPHCEPGASPDPPAQPGRVREYRARPAGRGRRSEGRACRRTRRSTGSTTVPRRLHVSSFLMEQYLEAADKVLDAAIVNGPRPWLLKKRFNIKDEKSVKPTGSVYRHLEDSVAIFSSWVSANIQVTLWSCLHPFPRQLPLPHLGLRVSIGQAHHVSRDGRHFRRGHRGTHSRLLRCTCRASRP